MTGSRLLIAIATLTCALPHQAAAQALDHLTPHNVTVTAADYQGRHGVKIVETGEVANGDAYAVVTGSAFHNGVIDVQVAGRPAPNAGEGARGFIGIAFRMHDGHYEVIYLRPTNGRAEDQVRRNHSTQYSSLPGFDFAQSRKDAPEKYESYVDLEPGAWTPYRIVVQGTTARLFVHGATQPCLIVNDLKLGDASGAIALWIGPGTEGYFSGLTISPSAGK